MVNAVKTFQKKTDNVADGVVGKSTLESLKTYANCISTKYNLGERNLQKGMFGNDITQLKNILIDNGLLQGKHFTEIEFFDEITREAVIKFQKATNLSASGIVDKPTINNLKIYTQDINDQTVINNKEFNLGDRVLKEGMSGKDVTQLKNILIDKKFLSGPFAKGETKFDNNIKNAVIRFQKSIGIDEDGTVDFQTVYFLKK